MKAYKLVTCVLGCVLALMATATAEDAPPLTFKFTTVNVPGALQTYPLGVNNAGVSVGQYQDKNMGIHGYILNGKKLTKLDDPNGTTFPSSLNLNGASVGRASPARLPFSDRHADCLPLDCRFSSVEVRTFDLQALGMRFVTRHDPRNHGEQNLLGW
jgi:hypothetical protein